MKTLTQIWKTKSGLTSLSAAATGLLLVGIVGCGGGGGGSSARTIPTVGPTNIPSVDPPPPPAPTPTPVPGGGGSTPTDPTACNDSTYVPNYLAGFRAGTNDPNGQPGQEVRHWKSFPLNIFFVANSENTVARKALVVAGFNQWVKATNGVHWVETMDKSKATSVVEIQTYDPAKTGAIVGLTQYAYGQGSLELIPYNQDITRTDPDRAGYMILGFTGNAVYDEGTAAHEFGHLLGIGGHSPDKPDLMYYTGNDSGLLTTSDINTLRRGYCDNFNQGGAPRTYPRTGRIIRGAIR